MIINKYKTRLVAKGFLQQHGSLVVKSVAIKIIITLGITNKWDLLHLDVNDAFLNGLFDETTYMQQCSFGQDDKSLVCKLNKSLYSFKQIPNNGLNNCNQYIQARVNG